ncbi:hypothetical protein, partial [Methanobrevibacter sp.]|uniref:hypothetical protein n=1 Tax=Methanobrevibacter sp. TaxID=66852 RepID=UPI003D7DE285
QNQLSALKTSLISLLEILKNGSETDEKTISSYHDSFENIAAIAQNSPLISTLSSILSSHSLINDTLLNDIYSQNKINLFLNLIKNVKEKAKPTGITIPTKSYLYTYFVATLDKLLTNNKDLTDLNSIIDILNDKNNDGNLYFALKHLNFIIFNQNFDLENGIDISTFVTKYLSTIVALTNLFKIDNENIDNTISRINTYSNDNDPYEIIVSNLRADPAILDIFHTFLTTKINDPEGTTNFEKTKDSEILRLALLNSKNIKEQSASSTNDIYENILQYYLNIKDLCTLCDTNYKNQENPRTANDIINANNDLFDNLTRASVSDLCEINIKIIKNLLNTENLFKIPLLNTEKSTLTDIFNKLASHHNIPENSDNLQYIFSIYNDFISILQKENPGLDAKTLINNTENSNIFSNIFSLATNNSVHNLKTLVENNSLFDSYFQLTTITGNNDKLENNFPDNNTSVTDIFSRLLGYNDILNSYENHITKIASINPDNLDSNSILYTYSILSIYDLINQNRTYSNINSDNFKNILETIISNTGTFQITNTNITNIKYLNSVVNNEQTSSLTEDSNTHYYKKNIENLFKLLKVIDDLKVSSTDTFEKLILSLAHQNESGSFRSHEDTFIGILNDSRIFAELSSNWDNIDKNLVLSDFSLKLPDFVNNIKDNNNRNQAVLDLLKALKSTHKFNLDKELEEKIAGISDPSKLASIQNLISLTDHINIDLVQKYAEYNKFAINSKNFNNISTSDLLIHIIDNFKNISDDIINDINTIFAKIKDKNNSIITYSLLSISDLIDNQNPTYQNLNIQNFSTKILGNDFINFVQENISDIDTFFLSSANNVIDHYLHDSNQDQSSIFKILCKNTPDTSYYTAISNLKSALNVQQIDEKDYTTASDFNNLRDIFKNSSLYSGFSNTINNHNLFDSDLKITEFKNNTISYLDCSKVDTFSKLLTSVKEKLTNNQDDLIKIFENLNKIVPFNPIRAGQQIYTYTLLSLIAILQKDSSDTQNYKLNRITYTNLSDIFDILNSLNNNADTDQKSLIIKKTIQNINVLLENDKILINQIHTDNQTNDDLVDLYTNLKVQDQDFQAINNSIIKNLCGTSSTRNNTLQKISALIAAVQPIDQNTTLSQNQQQAIIFTLDAINYQKPANQDNLIKLYISSTKLFDITKTDESKSFDDTYTQNQDLFNCLKSVAALQKNYNNGETAIDKFTDLFDNLMDKKPLNTNQKETLIHMMSIIAGNDASTQPMIIPSKELFTALFSTIEALNQSGEPFSNTAKNNSSIIQNLYNLYSKTDTLALIPDLIRHIITQNNRPLSNNQAAILSHIFIKLKDINTENINQLQDYYDALNYLLLVVAQDNEYDKYIDDNPELFANLANIAVNPTAIASLKSILALHDNAKDYKISSFDTNNDKFILENLTKPDIAKNIISNIYTALNGQDANQIVTITESIVTTLSNIFKKPDVNDNIKSSVFSYVFDTLGCNNQDFSTNISKINDQLKAIFPILPGFNQDIFSFFISNIGNITDQNQLSALKTSLISLLEILKNGSETDEKTISSYHDSFENIAAIAQNS